MLNLRSASSCVNYLGFSEVLQFVSLNCFVGEDSYLTFCTVVFVNIRNNAAGDLCCRGGGSVVLAVVGGICGVLGGAGLTCGSGSRGWFCRFRVWALVWFFVRSSVVIG